MVLEKKTGPVRPQFMFAIVLVFIPRDGRLVLIVLLNWTWTRMVSWCHLASSY